MVERRRSRSRTRAHEHGATSRGSSTRSCPWIHDDCGGPQEIATSASASAPTTRSTSRSSGPTCSRSRSACRATTTRPPGTGGASAATAAYFNNPMDYVAHLGGDHLDWLRGRVERPAGLRPGPVGGHDGRARELQAPRRPAVGEGHPRTSSTSGATTSRTTGRPGEHSSPIICHGSADGRDHAPDRPAARDRGGLADRLRDARLPARPDRRRVGHDAPPDDGADHDGAVRPARHGALRPRRRPARVLVLPPARVAQEGRADGRRLPAQQPVHVPVDGEARGLLRDAAARAEGAADRAGAAQEPARQRALRLHRRQVQPAVRPRRDRRDGRLPAVHEALRRRAVDRRQPHPRQRRAAPRLRRVGPAADAPAGLDRGLRRVRALAVDRRRDDGHALPARAADARPLRGRPRLPLAARSATRCSRSAG